MTRVIGVVLKPGVPEAVDELKVVLDALPDSRILVESEGHHAVPHLPDRVEAVSGDELANESDLVIVLGGDGTFIHAASLLQHQVVPILGINLGHIGFLTDVKRDELERTLPLALEGKLPHSDRMRLDVKIVRGEEVVLQRRILNDTTVSPAALARISTYEVRLDGDMVNTIRGDGVIVSTPTGSTAYAMAAGGSILTPNLDAIAITPICSHQLSQRQLVIKAEGALTVSLASDTEVFATCDGQAGVPFERGDRMVIERAPVPVRILKGPDQEFFRTLRTKLGWGHEGR